MWTRGLAPWYASHGRHSLPWRATRDPWAVLVSEVMLQQTQVARVLPRWHEFVERWPAPHAMAAAPLEEVLRAWQGLGYPRRAVALHRSAACVAAQGWPPDEPGLRRLPGVGEYTARALLTLAFEAPSAPPRDVNVARVTARAALGCEPRDAGRAAIDAAAAAGRPRSLSRRDYTLALFDAGAIHCRARPVCTGCPLRSGCASRTRLQGATGPRPGRRQAAYAGSFRQLRGAVLASLLGESPPATLADLANSVDRLIPAPPPQRLAQALASLVDDGLMAPGRVAAPPG